VLYTSNQSVTEVEGEVVKMEVEVQPHLLVIRK
jgi:hypothetical protein